MEWIATCEEVNIHSVHSRHWTCRQSTCQRNCLPCPISNLLGTLQSFTDVSCFPKCRFKKTACKTSVSFDLLHSDISSSILVHHQDAVEGKIMSYWVAKITEIRITKDGFPWLFCQWWYRKEDIGGYKVTINGDAGKDGGTWVNVILSMILVLTLYKLLRAEDILTQQLGEFEVVKTDYGNVVSPTTVKSMLQLIISFHCVVLIFT